MRVTIAPEAEVQLALRRRWWHENRTKAPELFDRELSEIIERIEQTPESFPIFTERGAHVIRRGLMRKTRCHLYFEIRPGDEIWILGAGGGQRRRHPQFRLQESP